MFENDITRTATHFQQKILRMLGIFNTGFSFDVIEKKSVIVFGGASTTKVTYYIRIKNYEG